jgi:hypothetical protein
MKRIIIFLITFVLLCTLITPIVGFAAEVEEAPAEEISYHTIFTRIYEYVCEHDSQIISAAGSGILLIFGAITKAATKRKNKETEGTLELIANGVSGTATTQDSVIKAVNVMAQGYNEMRAAYEKYEAVEDDRNRLVGACLVTNTALLEILSRVFVHNKNMPQGVKDYIMLQYTNAQKIIGDDAALESIVEDIRKKLNEVAAEVNEDEKPNEGNNI